MEATTRTTQRVAVALAISLVLFLAGCARAEPSIVPTADGLSAATDANPAPAPSTQEGPQTPEVGDDQDLDADPSTPADGDPTETDPTGTAGTAGTGLPAEGPAADDRIVIASEGGGVYLVDGDGTNRIDLAADGAGTALHPVWRPDGRRVAWSLADSTGFSVMSSNVDGTELRRAQSPFGGYFGSWDPTSSTLGFLGPAAPGTGLVFDSGTGAAMPGVVDRDTFYFFSWSPDGRQWIVHSGSGFRIKGIDGSTTPLDLNGGRFRAPVWAPDGSILVTLRGPNGNVIVQLDPDRQRASEIFTGGDETNFVLDPTGRYLAVQTTDVVRDNATDGLGEPGTVSTRRQPSPIETEAAVVIIDLATRGIIDIIETETGGLWWNPDGSKLAILAPHALDTPLVHWTVWSERETFNTAPFRLTPLYAQAYVPFFDQFAQSVTPWSPDGTRFVYPAISTDDERGIFVQVAVPDTPPRRISIDGILAFWSPT